MGSRHDPGAPRFARTQAPGRGRPAVTRVVAYFGTYDPAYPRNAVLIDGLRRLGVPAELSLEAHMGCGFGACWGCVKKIRRNGREEWLKVCEDGPVFQAEDVAWDGE